MKIRMMPISTVRVIGMQQLGIECNPNVTNIVFEYRGGGGAGGTGEVLVIL